jgi:hypothetical protein
MFWLPIRILPVLLTSTSALAEAAPAASPAIVPGSSAPVAPGGGMNSQVYLVRPDGGGLRRLTDGGSRTRVRLAFMDLAKNKDDPGPLWRDSLRRPGPARLGGGGGSRTRAASKR